MTNSAVGLRPAPYSPVRLVGYLTAASTILRLSSAALTVLIARRYGVTEYGAYATALALASLVALFPDAGMSLLITREGARDHETLPRLMRVALELKTWLSLVALIASLFVAWLLGYPALTFILVAVTTAGALVANYQQTYYAGYLAREENARAGVLTAGVGVFTLIGAASVIVFHGSVVAATVGGLCSLVDDGHTGFLVESRDPADYAAPVALLLHDVDLALEHPPKG